MSLVVRLAYFFALTLSLGVCSLVQAAGDQDITKLRTDWAIAKYQTPRNQQLPALEAVIARAKMMNQQHPNDPEIMLWYATALSSHAAIKGGLGSLPDVKKARELLEKVIQKNPNIEDGMALGVLGTLYARVPGWPVAFGSKEKARKYLEQAVQVAPQGSDANYYYGDFLVSIGDFQNGQKYLNIAKSAAVRSGYEVQDKGRKGEIAAALAKIKRSGR